MSYDKPFAGLKVIDVSQGVAGPYCAMLLAQYGANVIKVEPPGVGDWARNLGVVYGDQCAYSLPANLGKRAIALDLKQDDGQAILWRLIRGRRRVRAGLPPGRDRSPGLRLRRRVASANRASSTCRCPASARPARSRNVRRWIRSCRPIPA